VLAFDCDPANAEKLQQAIPELGVVTDLDAILARVTSDHVRAAARRFLDEQHVVTGVLRPAVTK
jgi:hypothetical protein